MKHFFIFLFLPLIACTQVKAPSTDFVLQAGKVFWQHTYESDLETEALMSTLLERIKSDPRHTEPTTTSSEIRFTVDNDRVNARKYGLKEFKLATVAKLYMKYDAVIEVKDKQYTVTVRNIFMDNKDRTDRKSGDVSSFVCNMSNLTFKTDPKVMEGLGLVDRHFRERFDLNVPPDENPLKR